MTTDEKPPKIEFPCADYPIKIVGRAEPDLHNHVITVMHRHVADFDETCISIRHSSAGSYQSFTVVITATGVDQLQAIFEDLKQSPAIQLVL